MIDLDLNAVTLNNVDLPEVVDANPRELEISTDFKQVLEGEIEQEPELVAEIDLEIEEVELPIVAEEIDQELPELTADQLEIEIENDQLLIIEMDNDPIDVETDIKFAKQLTLDIKLPEEVKLEAKKSEIDVEIDPDVILENDAVTIKQGKLIPEVDQKFAKNEFVVDTNDIDPSTDLIHKVEANNGKQPQIHDDKASKSTPVVIAAPTEVESQKHQETRTTTHVPITLNRKNEVIDNEVSVPEADLEVEKVEVHKEVKLDVKTNIKDLLKDEIQTKERVIFPVDNFAKMASKVMKPEINIPDNVNSENNLVETHDTSSELLYAKPTSTKSLRQVKSDFHLPLTMNESRFTPNLGNKLLYMLNGDVKRAVIHITPSELGPLDIQIQINKDQISVAFTSQHELTRDTLENSSVKLKEILGENGFTLANVDVFSQNLNQQNGDRTGNREATIEFEHNEQESDTILTPVNRHISRGLVDYFA